MKKIVFIVLAILTDCYCFAQSPSIEWQRCYGGNGTDYPLAIRNDINGGCVVIGFTFSANGDVIGNHGGVDFWILKLTIDGNIQWQKTLGGSSDDYGYSIEQTIDGGYIVAGGTYSIDGDVTGNHGSTDFWVVKLNSTGNIEWQKTLGGSNFDHAFNIKQTRDGGYIVTGSTYSIDGDITANHGAADIWLVKLDSIGNIQWQRTFGGSFHDTPYDVEQTKDNGFVLAGLTQSTDGDIIGSHGGIDTYIVKLNSLGFTEWQRTFGGTGDDRAYSIKETKENDGYVFVGSSSSNNGDVTGNHGGEDYWIVKLDLTGNIEWQNSIGDNGTQYARDFYKTNDDGYILNGVTNSVNGMPVDATNNNGSWLVKLDSDGNMQWEKVLGGNQGDDGSCVLQTPDGGYLIGSETQSFDIPGTTFHGIQDFLIVKLGNQLSTGTYESEFITVYPNPAKNILNVKINDSRIIDKITITEITGKLVFEQAQNPNPVNLEKLASGLYILEVSSGKDKWQTKFVKE